MITKLYKTKSRLTLPTHMHDWSLIGILFSLTQNFVRDRSRVTLTKRDVLQ